MGDRPWWYKVATLLLVVHALSLVTWVTLRVFGAEPPDIPMGTATAIGAVYGLPALAYGLWKWRGYVGKTSDNSSYSRRRFKER